MNKIFKINKLFKDLSFYTEYKYKIEYNIKFLCVIGIKVNFFITVTRVILIS